MFKDRVLVVRECTITPLAKIHLHLNKRDSTEVWSCNTLKNNFSKTCTFLLSTCVGHSSLSCGTLICILSVGNSFKTCIISVDLGKKR